MPLEARLEAADLLIQGGIVAGADALEVMLAATCPSSETYWVRPRAVSNRWHNVPKQPPGGKRPLDV